MQTDFVKAALIAGWVLAVGARGYMSGITSSAAWTLLAVVSMAPAAFMVPLWNSASPTMSETIREVLR